MGTFLLLLVEIQSHDMIFLQIFDLPLLVDELTLLIFQFFLGDDPVIVDSFSFLLVVGQ